MDKGISGQYELLADESESFEPYLKILGHGEVVRLASNQINIHLEVLLTDSHYTVFQKTQVGHTRRTVKLNANESFIEVSPEFSLTRKVNCKFNKEEIILLIETNDSNITTKTTVEGEALVFETHILRGIESATVKRKFKRVGDISPEIQQAHDLVVKGDLLGEVARVTPSSIRQKREKEQKRLAKIKKAEEKARFA